MSELIGVNLASSVDSVATLKQQLLLFDRLAFWGLIKLGEGAGNSPELTQVTGDVGYLAQRGVAFEVDKIALHGKENSEPHRVLIEQIQKEKQITSGVFLRAIAADLRLEKGLNAVAALPAWPGYIDVTAGRAEVVEIVVNRLPIPGEHHGLEDVLAFRDEAHADGSIQSLRVWMNDVAKGTLTAGEVSDKLDDLLIRFERALKLQRMSSELGIVGTVVVTMADIAESLVKFKWSQLARKLFQIRRKQIDLLRGELNLPGREIAYLVKARNRF